MANNELVTVGTGSNRWLDAAEPYDAKAIFDTLEQACGENTADNSGELGTTNRFKGQKFVVKNPPPEISPNGEPKEYWFTKDYQPPGAAKLCWIFTNGDDFFKDYIGRTKAEIQAAGLNNTLRDKLVALGFITTSQWTPIWNNPGSNPTYWENQADPEIIPEPVLYQPGGSGGVDINTDELTGDKLKAEAVSKKDATLNLNGESLYLNDNDEPLTINEYADRQPEMAAF